MFVAYSALTGFELAYVSTAPFHLPLHREIRRRLLRLATMHDAADILDVGGRKSHYTIGVPGRITISDLPRETAVQKQLNLGVTEDTIQQTRMRRSNVRDIVIDDMTRSSLPEASFDYVVAVEVLEHVEEDALFVQGVSRVLRPGGVFLMTTPNGDCVPNINPDHKRHYKRSQLHQLLGSCFGNVSVEYAIAGGRFRTLGLRPWQFHRPLHTVVGMMANVINSYQSSRKGVEQRAIGTRHLLAMATHPLGKKGG